VNVRWLVLTLFSIGLGNWARAGDLAEQIRAAQAAGQYGEAAQLYLRLVAEGTDTPEIRSNCGIMLHLAGKNREALEQFRIALRRNPDLAGANLFAGLAELDLGESRAALAYLQRAEKLDPARPAPLLATAKAYVALREYGLANERYTKAAALDPNLAEAWYGIGVTDRSLAELLLNRAAREGKADDDSVRRKAQQLLDGALQALARAVELDPRSAHTHLIMAESLSDAGKLAEAVSEYQVALKLDPSLEAANLGLASQYWKQRQFEDALPLLKHVLLKSPQDPEANGMMADILQHNGDNASAKRHADIALAGNPDLIETRVVLARIYIARQEPKLAVAELRKVISADPDGSYHFLLYRAYQQLGDEGSAKSALTEFQQLRSRQSKQ
jgi:tetratricopeptide (TPR) repeat protein